MDRFGWILAAMGGIVMIRLAPSRGARLLQASLAAALIATGLGLLWQTGGLTRSLAWFQTHAVAAVIGGLAVLTGAILMTRRR